jgi:hypothetical protein
MVDILNQYFKISNLNEYFFFDYKGGVQVSQIIGEEVTHLLEKDVVSCGKYTFVNILR